MDEGISIFTGFYGSFDPSVIYEVGWYAAQSWTATISIVILVISIWIRSIHENINMMGGGRSGLNKMVVEVLVTSVCIALYLVLAHLLVGVFNAIYESIDGHTIDSLTTAMRETIGQIYSKPKEWSLSVFADTIIGYAAIAAFYLTLCILVAISFFLRLLHAILVSLCLFWGAIALPMSIAIGKDALTSFKRIVLFTLFWPVVEAFLMFISSSVLANMMQSEAMSLSNVGTISSTQAAVAFSAFAIMNLILIATAVGAPFVTQGLVNGTGSVSGMVGSFAGAGLVAGSMAFNAAKQAAKGGKNGLIKVAESGLLGSSARVVAGTTSGSVNPSSNASADMSSDQNSGGEAGPSESTNLNTQDTQGSNKASSSSDDSGSSSPSDSTPDNHLANSESSASQENFNPEVERNAESTNQQSHSGTSVTQGSEPATQRSSSQSEPNQAEGGDNAQDVKRSAISNSNGLSDNSTSVAESSAASSPLERNESINSPSDSSATLVEQNPTSEQNSGPVSETNTKGPQANQGLSMDSESLAVGGAVAASTLAGVQALDGGNAETSSKKRKSLADDEAPKTQGISESEGEKSEIAKSSKRSLTDAQRKRNNRAGAFVNKHKQQTATPPKQGPKK